MYYVSGERVETPFKDKRCVNQLRMAAEAIQWDYVLQPLRGKVKALVETGCPKLIDHNWHGKTPSTFR